MTGTSWVQLAETRILEILDEQYAVTQPELIARLSPESGPYWESRESLEPTVVGDAVANLIAARQLIRDTASTRGGRPISTLALRNQKGIKTYVHRAARRKRLLTARYYSWSQPSKEYPNGITGPAGEKAVKAAIKESEALSTDPNNNLAKTYAGVTFNGPLDWAGMISSPEPPFQSAAALMEVKNVRSWLYPSSAEVHQLLRKAAVFQQAHPDAHVVPLLVCRRLNRRMWAMAKHLGFRVLDMRVQPTSTIPDEEHFNEVRIELGYYDLRRDTQAPENVVKLLRGIQKTWSNASERWKVTSTIPNIAERFSLLSDKTFKDTWERKAVLQEIGEDAAQRQRPPHEWWSQDDPSDN